MDTACKEHDDTGVSIKPMSVSPSLFICGGGHIGQALARTGKRLGYKIVVIDDRPEYASEERFPGVDLYLVKEYTGVFNNIQVDRSGYIVIVTHGHQGDEAALTSALRTKAYYIGMIGSRKKVATIYAHLLEEGISQELIDKVHAPIGLPIQALTPSEIAISILAEITAVRRGLAK
jgi:xanthine dehydrogenase accessory factor